MKNNISFVNSKLFTLIIILNLTVGLCAQTFLNNHVYYNVTSSVPPLTVEAGNNAYYNAPYIIIPETVTNNGITYSVTSISDRAFTSSTNLTSVTLPTTVTTIGLAAFSYCSSLASITIPGSVTIIRDDALNYCVKLTSINVDANNTNFTTQEGVLYNKDKTTLMLYPPGKQGSSFDIPESVTNIGYNAFRDCIGLTSIKIPNSVSSIEPFAFCGCSVLTYIVIPASVTNIKDCAFRGCRGLTCISILGYVTSIGQFAFDSCIGLNTFYLNNPTPSTITLGTPVFTSNVPFSTCILYVPIGSKSLYQGAPQWKDFTNIVETTTVVPTVIDKSIKLYPSSIKDKFKVIGLTQNATLNILDINGRLFLTKQVANNENVPVSSLPQGVYFVRITLSEGTIVRKIVKD